jgi:hypothetical protein
MSSKPNIYAESQNSDFNMIKGSNQPKYTGEVQYESFSDLIEKPKKKGFLGLMRQGSGGRSRRHKGKTTRRHKRKMRSTLRRKKGLGKKSRKH